MTQVPVCTVAELLEVAELGLALLTPRADLSRRVRWVQTTELPDPSPYLRPDELVCTSGTALDTKERSRRFAEAVAGTASALCFGVGDVHSTPPTALVEVCRRRGLPLLTLPYGVPFLAVAEVVEASYGRAARARSVGQLLDLVLDGLARPDSLRDALAEAGLEPAVLVVGVWPPGSSSVLSRALPEGVVAETRRHTVTVTATVGELSAAVASGVSLRCGYSGPAPLADLAASLSTAALAFAACAEGAEPCGPSSVASFDALLQGMPRGRLAPFVASLIVPLERAGGRLTPTYVDTLRAFLAHDLSVGRTAKAQFLHPNTVRHRLELVRELTGKDPFVTDDLLALAVAVRARDLGITG